MKALVIHPHKSALIRCLPHPGLGMALFIAGCMSQPVVPSRASILIDPAQPTLGDKVTFSIRNEDGSRCLHCDNLLADISASPEGILERVSDDTMEVVGAGKAILAFNAVSKFNLSREVTIDCPEQSDTVTLHTEDVLDEDSTWKTGIHRVEGTIHVRNAALTIEACSSVIAAPGAALVVGEGGPSQIIVRGSREHPIVIDSEAPQTRWGGIRIFVQNSAASALRWLTLRNADGLESTVSDISGRAVVDLVGEECVFPETTPIAMEGVTIEDCGDSGFRLYRLGVTNNFHWRHNKVRGCQKPIVADAASLGAIPKGTYTQNTINEVEMTGGWTGGNRQIWVNPGIAYRVENRIIVAPANDRCSSVPFSRADLGGIFVGVEAGSVFRFESDTGIFLGADTTGLQQCLSDSDCEDGAGCRAPFNFCWNDQGSPLRFITYGSYQEPVTFTSAQENPTPGDWIGVVFMPNTLLFDLGPRAISTNSLAVSGLNGTIVEWAGQESGLWWPDATPVKGGVIVDRSLFSGMAVFAYGSTVIVEGSLLRYNDGYGLVSPIKDHELLISSLSRYTWVPSCLCGNVLGAISPKSDGETMKEDSALAGQACPCTNESGTFWSASF